MAYHIQMHPPVSETGIIHDLGRCKNRQYTGSYGQHLNQSLYPVKYACRIISFNTDTRTGNNFQPITSGNLTVVPIDQNDTVYRLISRTLFPLLWHIDPQRDT